MPKSNINKIKNKNKKIKKNAKEQPKASLKVKFIDMLELPKEIVLNIPKLTIVGNSDMIIENYKGLIEYDNARIRINTGIGVIKITGIGLLIKEITSEDVIISGDIRGLEFIK
jgi:sporulation protein YqfC